MSSNIIKVDERLLPKSNRLHVGDHYVKLGQPKTRMPIVWNFADHLKFLQFLGYWLRKGYYDKYAVSLSTGKDLPDLMPILDYVSELFSCRYKVREDKVVKFDSAMLKYIMMGLSFGKKEKGKIAEIPNWITSLDHMCKKHFLQGYLTASAVIKHDHILFKQVAVIPIHDVIFQIANISYMLSDHEIRIPARGMQHFKENIGFLSQQKSLELDQVIFTYHL